VKYELKQGDNAKTLKQYPDNYFDSIVTDPPYGIEFMAKAWDNNTGAVETWQECFRVLKPGGHILAFSASRTYHHLATNIESVGFEIRDQIMWLYGSGFPKSLNIGKAIDKKLGNKRTSLGTKIKKAGDMRSGNYDKGGDYDDIELEITKGDSEWEGWGTALKPAHEPVVMARKPLSEKSIVDNVLKHGTGGINIDASRIEGDVKHPDSNPDFRDQGKKSKEAIGIDKLSFGQVTGAKRKKTQRKPRSKEGVWTEDNSGMKAAGSEFADADPRGRFPANVMHDGSDAVQEIFPNTKSGKDKNPTTKNVSGFFGQDMGYYSKEANYGDEGSAARFFYCPKVSKSERNDGLDAFPEKLSGTNAKGYVGDGIHDHEPRNVMNRNTHPTVKPVELMKYLCRLVTPKGGTVLDPFMGSGSTGIAAKDEGFDFIGIEMEEEYFNIASSRIGSSSPLMDFM